MLNQIPLIKKLQKHPGLSQQWSCPIAGLYWLGEPEEAMTEFPLCRDEALHDSMKTLLEKEFGLEVSNSR
jgi:hypothetical protein